MLKKLIFFHICIFNILSVGGPSDEERSHLLINRGSHYSFNSGLETTEENRVISRDFLVEFLKGSQGISCCDKKTFSSISAAVLGVVSSSFSYVLGEEYGEDNLLKTKSFGIVTGISSVIPLASLGAKLSYDVFHQLFMDKDLKIFMKKENKFLCIGKNFGFFVLGALSSVPIFFMNQKSFDHIGDYIWFIQTPTLVARTAIGFWATRNISKILYGSLNSLFCKKSLNLRMRDDLSYRKRVSLLTSVGRSKQRVMNFTESQSKSILDSLDENDFSSIFSFDQEPEYTSIKKTNRKKIAAGLLGNVVGLASSWCLYKFTEEYSKTYFVDKLPEEANECISQSFAVSSTVALASLLTYTTGVCFENFYGFVENIPKKFKCLKGPAKKEKQSSPYVGGAIAFTSTLFAIGATFPRLDIATKYIGTKPYQIPLVVCAAIGPFAQDFWSTDALLTQIWKRNSKKSFLLNSLTKLEKSIPYLTEKNVDALLQIMGETSYENI